MKASKKKKLSFWAVCFTFFVDYLCWAVVFPIFAPYFVDERNQIFSADVALGTRTMVLGLFLMAFSLGQFLGAPLIGEYADRHGRKKALIVSVVGTFVGLGVSAYCMGINDLYGLFVGRLITGVFASSTTVCLSCASDLSENEKTKVKNFGTLSMIAGLAFIVGAFAGGKLSDRTLNASFSDNFPLWIAAGVTLLNLVFIVFGFKETAGVHPHVKYHFLESFRHIKVVLQTEKIKRIYALYFLFFMSWTILFQFIPVLMVKRFSFTNSNIGDLALFMGVSWAIGSGYLNKFLVQKFSSMRVLEVCFIGFTVFCAFVVVFNTIPMVMALIALCIFCGSIAWPICTGLISSKAPQNMQGKVMGLSQSVQSLAMTIGPVIAGFAFHYSLVLPFFTAAAIGFLAVIIYYLALKYR